MKGTNKLELNTSTLIEALQEYLERRILNETFEVTGIVKGSSYGGDTFEVTLESKEREK